MPTIKRNRGNMTTTEDLDDIAEEIRNTMDRLDIPKEYELPDLPDHNQHQANLLNTQAVLSTTNNWSLSEAAEILCRHYGRDTASKFSKSDRKRAMERLIAEVMMIDRHHDDVARVRQAWLDADQSTYDGPTELDESQVPSAFDD
jgi:hypothetical protein